MNFATLFELRVEHAFYAGGPCPDVALEPTEAGRALARNQRWILQPLADGLRVVTALDDAGEPALPVAADAVFACHLQAKTADFELFTDCAAHQTMSAPLYQNGDSAQGGALSLQDRPGGRRARGTIADVEIGNLAALGVAGEPPVFRVALQARRALWAYYLVTNVVPGDFVITDTAAATAIGFTGEGSPRDLVASPDPDDPVAVDLARQHPGMRLLRFVSDALVPCHEQPRQHIELHLDGVRKLANLPNPAFRRYSMLATTSSTGTAGDGATELRPSFFHIIRHITRTLTTV